MKQDPVIKCFSIFKFQETACIQIQGKEKEIESLWLHIVTSMYFLEVKHIEMCPIDLLLSSKKLRLPFLHKTKLVGGRHTKTKIDSP